MGWQATVLRLRSLQWRSSATPRSAQDGEVFYGKISPAMVEPEELPEFESSQATNIMHADVQSVHAERVQMHQADAETITADEVELHQSAAGNVKATLVHARQSALGAVRAENVSVEQSAAGFVQAENVSTDSCVGVLAAGNVEIQHGAVGYMTAHEVRAENVRTTLLLARNVQGDVTTILDARGALIAGLVGGLFGGLMLLLGRFLLRRN
ncbi:MAG: hypothetical protein KJZ52_07240 [Anaerolineales bacterium]|nr:hypothetical protein [Anaerolineales bacterium]